ncbi:MAG: hypothetical protein MRJ68_20670 [Nitrospira sp.]|nr:hypothetical protein [Nitrospira sp.]
MQKVEDTVLATTPRGSVSLHSVNDSWFRTTHPVSVSPLILTHVLQGVQVETAPGGQTTGKRVFSDEETAFLSPLLSMALFKATKSQLVAFRVMHGSGPDSEMAGGFLFTRGRLLHLWLTHYRSNGFRNDSGASLDRQDRNPRGLTSRQLRFVPEAAQRSSHNQQPDLIDPPPLATLVIDYPVLAIELNLLPETPPSQLPYGDEAQRDHPDTHSVQPNHGLSNSQAEETQALKDVVKEQAIELDALKEDVRTLRRKLSEMERLSPKP